MLEARPQAKVNLALEVGPRRADGYHDLRSVFLRIGLADVLGVTATAMQDTLTVGGLPCPVEGNLVLRAFELLRRTVDHNLPGLAATLDKRIPIGAGLGGGSSDAAAALGLAAAAWDMGISPDQRLELAIQLGSDVPFFAADLPAALVEGRGEKVTPLLGVPAGAGILLALSVDSLSTANVFALFDAMGRPKASATDWLVDALTTSDLADLSGDLREANELWPAAALLAPGLVDRRSDLERRTGRTWLMSGSGPTLFALFPSAAEAVEVGRSLEADQSAALRGVILCATDLEGPDPAWRQEWPTEP